VSDTGIGIPEDEMERIFKPFERVVQAGTPMVNGTGLGLTITRLLLDILGGEIEVSANPAGGTTFTVWLMLSHLSGVDLEIKKHRKIYGYRGPRKTIMIVDDDPSQRGLIADVLHPLGFVVLESQDANKCLASCKDHVPDVFLLDISMPEINGLELAKILRDLYPQKHIIMVSAVVMQEADFPQGENEARSYYDDYLIKPVKIDALLQKIATHLKIEWVYDASEASKDESFTGHSSLVSPEFSLTDLPSEEVLDELHLLADIGHLSGLRRKISEMEIENNAGENFIRQMRDLVNNVKFEAIKNLLKMTRVNN